MTKVKNVRIFKSQNLTKVAEICERKFLQLKKKKFHEKKVPWRKKSWKFPMFEKHFPLCESQRGCEEFWEFSRSGIVCGMRDDLVFM